ncbi:unnamed protein product [Coffea canephora]|uniref:Uncharacterized protein n=1 Tax=Coffea canephora TaxID=49390 RepID=A0A068UVB2_COFCA|nr:unnamed protein product [Coffea canephora]
MLLDNEANYDICRR